MTAEVAIVDSGGANLASLRFALERIGADSFVTRDAATIRNASHVILPGVGAAGDAMQRLRDAGLVATIAKLSQPVLGICLGLQLLATQSDENDTRCLGIVSGRSRKLAGSPECPSPNMGWCAVRKTREHPLLDGIDDGAWFYFVHGYALPPLPQSIATAEHDQTFSAVIEQNNFMATQFHPERSSSAGARVLANFVSLPA